MCRIKSGVEVINNEDIRNLITGVILRQKRAYSKDQIVATVLYYLNGASVKIDNKNVSKLVDNGLDILVRNDEVTCWNGLFQTAGID